VWRSYEGRIHERQLQLWSDLPVQQCKPSKRPVWTHFRQHHIEVTWPAAERTWWRHAVHGRLVYSTFRATFQRPRRSLLTFLYYYHCIAMLQLPYLFIGLIQTSSVAVGFGQHGKPPPACNTDLRPFDLETCMRVASKVGNLPFKFGHGRPLGSRIILYVRDGRTDRQTNRRMDGRTNATLITSLFPKGAGA